MPLAVALLNSSWPPEGFLPGISGRVPGDDRRYLIGRFQQALSVLLAGDLPPMDAPTALLSQSLGDAIAWREHVGRDCPDCGRSLCAACAADAGQADRYHALARALGAVGDLPAARPTATPCSPPSAWQ